MSTKYPAVEYKCLQNIPLCHNVNTKDFFCQLFSFPHEESSLEWNSERVFLSLIGKYCMNFILAYFIPPLLFL